MTKFMLWDRFLICIRKTKIHIIKQTYSLCTSIKIYSKNCLFDENCIFEEFQTL